MKKLIFLIFKGFELFKQNFALNIIATIFFIYLIFFVVGYSTNVFFDDLSREQTIRAFIKEGKSDQAAIVINNLKTLKAIKSIKFYSKEDAFKYLKEQIKNLGEIEKIPKQLFPEFIEISLNQEYNNIEYIKDILSHILW